MTSEDKELLIKDLCARLPYGVQCCAKNNHKISGSLVGIIGENVHIFSSGHGVFSINVIKLYLFPLSSMTEEEKEEYCKLQQRVIYNSKGVVNEDVTKYINWCYEKHLDINNLIPMGLAIDATGLNIY